METELLNIVQKLTEAIDGMKDICERQCATLERCQEDVRDLIRANMEMSRALEHSREDYRETIRSYREELQSAKRQYNRVSELYVLKTEGKHAGNRSDININV